MIDDYTMACYLAFIRRAGTLRFLSSQEILLLKTLIMKLENKIAIVTGAGSGIGRAQALLFAREGAIVIAIDRNLDTVREVAKEIFADNGTTFPIEMDVTDEHAVKAMVTDVIYYYGKIDVLSNTAGLLDGFKKSLETSIELWDHVINVNLRAVFVITNGVLPHMIEQRSGSIINMASIGAFGAGAGGAVYTTSKHAILGYTRQLSKDYAGYGVRTNALSPGLIETPLTHDFFKGDQEVVSNTLAGIPAGRPGQAIEIAKAALFLACDDSSYMYGSALIVDGGVTARLT
jgi:3-oxoacyl-[acyl-carrier protein] reductase